VFNVSAELYVRGVGNGTTKDALLVAKNRYDDAYIKLVVAEQNSMTDIPNMFYFDQVPYVESGRIFGPGELQGFTIPYRAPTIPGASLPPAPPGLQPNARGTLQSLSLAVFDNFRNWAISTAQIHACISNELVRPDKRRALKKTDSLLFAISHRAAARLSCC